MPQPAGLVRGHRAEAIADSPQIYADQNERDYALFQAAVKDGTVESATEI